ncbi:PucR family transcriptional regulator [Nocardioides sp. LHG3406-4]|uniref:PucR family transcriptional regulator n=1 Tax=Nocardioides sp. LHG3406-4 TaxID=2804575 RepID=UPI003CF5EADE
MALTLQAVLDHPGFGQAQPLVMSGDPAARLVRWVHSSDIYDIAPLLRGGELLLTTGLGLAGSTPAERRAYVRALADRDVAGLALELGETFPEVPDEMVREARAVGLPFIVLGCVYPFVEVTEQINSAILDRSIVRLRHADDVARALSRVLAQRGGLDGLTTTLADLVGRPVVVTDATGLVLAAAADDVPDVLRGPAATAPVTADGLLLGRLAIGHGTSDPDLVRAATDRAPEIFALEVLRGHQQPLLSGRERRLLLTSLLDGDAGGPGPLAAHAAASHIRPDSQWVGLAISSTGQQPGLALAQDVAHEVGAQALAAELDGTTYALLAVPARHATEALGTVRERLSRARGPVSALGGLGPLSGAGRSLRAADQALRLHGLSPRPGPLVLAEDVTVERLLAAVGTPLQLTDLVAEQLGGLMRARNAETLLSTLHHYLASGGSKAATARALHLRRQSVHQRLARIAEHLGHDIDDPTKQTALRLALAARSITDVASAT